VSYEVLGDQECFALKYAWELTVYFTFFVFPFINDLFTDLKFVASYLREFAKLGARNRALQTFIASYYRWKKPRRAHQTDPLFFDFTELGPLRNSEELFYKVGLTAEAAVYVLTREMCKLDEFARYIVAYVSSVVSGNSGLLTNREFVEGLDLDAIRFEPEVMRGHAAVPVPADQPYHWGFDPWCIKRAQGRMNQERDPRIVESANERLAAAV
jgi:hypothetical protein